MGYTKDRKWDDRAWNSKPAQDFRNQYQLRIMSPEEVRLYYPDFNPEEADRQYAVDHVLYSERTGRIILEQTRFRKIEYANKYDDFTLRYTRNYSKRVEEHMSEFYKLKRVQEKFPGAKLLLFYEYYDEEKNEIPKLAIIDLEAVSRVFEEGRVRVIDTAVSYEKAHYIPEINGISAEKRYNHDKSSEFVAIKPVLLDQIQGQRMVWLRGKWNGREYNQI